MKKLLSALLALVMVAALLPATPLFADEASWEDGIWTLEQLETLGAVPPTYNQETKQYEISQPEQLLFMSGFWKNSDGNGDGFPDAPCDGYYVLTADIDMEPLNEKIGKVIGRDGYMPPIAASTKEAEGGGEKCAFFGTFDGAGHAIYNLSVYRMDSKYCGFIGNVGYDYGEGYVKNLSILNARIEGKASCGILTGSVQGDIDNVVCTGTIICHEKTAGGLAGKIKKNDNGYVGCARNCYVDVDITILGEGGENGASGLITAANSNGGAVYNCYAIGSINVEGKNAETVAGISGNLKGATALDNNVAIARSIITEDGENIGYLCGSYAGETGSHLHNNYVWDGTNLAGNVTSDHPESASFTYATTAEVLSRAFYTDKLGWDFDSKWVWLGSDDLGFPVPAGSESFFAADGEVLNQLRLSLTSVPANLKPAEPMVSKVYEGFYEDLRFFFGNDINPIDISNATLYYGTGKTRDDCTAAEALDSLTFAFPETAIGTYYYYVTADYAGTTYTFPTLGVLKYEVADAKEKFEPEFVMISPGKDYSSVSLNWTTQEGGLTSELRWRLAGGSDWNVLPVTDITSVSLGDNKDVFASYSIDLTGLAADTKYEYMAVTKDAERTYQSPIYTFETLPEATSHFILVSDIQSTSEDGYLPYKYTMAGFLAGDAAPDFVVNLGDLTEDNTLAQWYYMEDTIGELMATVITAYAPGNHEGKNDEAENLFKYRTNLPDDIDNEMISESVGAFVSGDVCIVTLNTVPNTHTQADKMAVYEAQKQWAKAIFEASGCKWRIICAHAGLVQEDDEATAFLEDMCDELDVDVFFNGHIHNYYRATVSERAHAEVGAGGTTYVTTSPMGLKFDPFEDYLADVLDFQTGGSDDERQYFTEVRAEGDTLIVTAYQRTAAGDATSKNCKDYTVIDTFTLTKTAPAPAPERSGLPTWAYAAIGAAAVAVVAVIILAVSKKKKK